MVGEVNMPAMSGCVGAAGCWVVRVANWLQVLKGFALMAGGFYTKQVVMETSNLF